MIGLRNKLWTTCNLQYIHTAFRRNVIVLIPNYGRVWRVKTMFWIVVNIGSLVMGEFENGVNKCEWCGYILHVARIYEWHGLVWGVTYVFLCWHSWLCRFTFPDEGVKFCLKIAIWAFSKFIVLWYHMCIPVTHLKTLRGVCWPPELYPKHWTSGGMTGGLRMVHVEWTFCCQVTWPALEVCPGRVYPGRSKFAVHYT